MKISIGYSSCRTMLAMTVASMGRPLVKMPIWIGASGVASVAVTSTIHLGTALGPGHAGLVPAYSELLLPSSVLWTMLRVPWPALPPGASGDKPWQSIGQGQHATT